MTALLVRDLEMGFGRRPVLRGVNLRVRPGEVVGLAGANGSGKSTLLRLAAGLLHAGPGGRGSIRVAGLDPQRARRAGRVGWSSAAGGGSFTRRLSLEANLIVAGRIAGLGGGRLRARIDELAEWLGFREHLDVSADRCSTGIAQRAALARALLHAPPVLLLDEPLRGVDPASAQALARSLRGAWRREAVIWVSHSPDELARVADRCVALRGGRLGPVRERRAA